MIVRRRATYAPAAMPAVSAARLLGIRGTGGVFTTGYHQPYVGKRDAQAVYPSLNGRRCATFIGCHFYWHGGPSVRKDWNDAGHPGIFVNGNGLTIDACNSADMALRHLLVGPKAKSVIVAGTRFKGGLKIGKRGKAKVVTGQNISA